MFQAFKFIICTDSRQKYLVIFHDETNASENLLKITAINYIYLIIIHKKIPLSDMN